MRVVVWNAKGLRAGERAAQAIGALAPDVVILTECGRRRALDRFAQRIGMNAVTSAHAVFRRAVHNAVLSREPWRVASVATLRFERSQPFYPRGATIVRLRRPGSEVSVASTHLGLSPGERERHARELADAARSLELPLLLGGDFNEDPGSPAVSWVAQRYWDAWTAGADDATGGSTFPSRDPSSRIDYLFVSQGVRVASARVIDGADAREASDHLPLLVELELPAG
jgi:endonuclease/exonuclease/phosphatase family metal-dependent hydrolase